MHTPPLLSSKGYKAAAPPCVSPARPPLLPTHLFCPSVQFRSAPERRPCSSGRLRDIQWVRRRTRCISSASSFFLFFFPLVPPPRRFDLLHSRALNQTVQLGCSFPMTPSGSGASSGLAPERRDGAQ